MTAFDEDPTGLVILSSSSSSFQDRKRKTCQLFQRCRVVLQRLELELSSTPHHHHDHDHDNPSQPSDNMSAPHADLYEQLPLYHLQFQTLTKYYNEQLEEMKRKDDELTLYIEDDGSDDEDDVKILDQKAFADDHDDHVHYQHDVVVVGDNDANEFPDYCDSSFRYWKGQPPPHAIGRRVMDWSFVLDEPFSEMDALQFTID